MFEGWFRIITSVVLILGVMSFPWLKKPLGRYATKHIYGCLLVWLCGLSLLHWYFKSTERSFVDYYVFLAMACCVTGTIVLIKNYRQ